MSWLEFLGDNRKENVGTLEIEEREYREEGFLASLLKFLAAMAAIVLVAVLARPSLGYSLLLLAYLALGYGLRIEPNTRDLGLLGGLLDHPFKYTDDLNRFLLWAKILLFPGRLVATPIVGFVKKLAAMLRRARG